jgi:hypothetical protein
LELFTHVLASTYLISGLEIFASTTLGQKQVLVVYLDVQQQSENPEDSIHHSEKEEKM